MSLSPPFAAVASLAGLVGLAGLAVSAGYALLALIAVLVWELRRTGASQSPLPAVTILKPLCGAEPGLYAHLRSYCEQDYPQFQIVFGVRDRADPALAVVERLVRDFPQAALDIVVNPQLHGSNYKISNLINMLAVARHDVLVMADSDTFVSPDYLRTVTAPLEDPRVGLVTCLYQDVPTAGVWSRLGAMYINEWYMPSVLVAWLFGHQGYVSGQSLCLRAWTLQAIGGLPALADQLADDHRLGELVRSLGLRVVLSRYLPRAQHVEVSYDSLRSHELRWMRTIRVLQPAGFRLMCLSFSLPLGVLGLAFAHAQGSHSTAAWALLGITLFARLALHFRGRWRDRRSLFADLWLLPLRDLLMCWVWCGSFLSSRVIWRGNEFDVGADGVMRPLS
jgi:ceramide glucosyltransferase